MSKDLEYAQEAIDLIQKAYSKEEVLEAYYLMDKVVDPCTIVVDEYGGECEFYELWGELFSNKESYTY